ncbi:hypothetical protein SNE26_10300 [Mucilaginibacter sp. cycad4]|uniref:hypothetical protein n=1 Tax=Mucilaginibacter sp. cycad4 TaxID=3342096 RepID=UPI002AAC0ED3|nr:hypothetical protein [Mucilaginibacter gossypii]WPV02166.1 hypothetical protein SNE26_10300 [Mucilaginibacter gossypii]
MKPLNNLNNIEKAKLLHELFPDEIPQLLAEILAVCEDFRANKTAYSEQWQSGRLMTFDNWLQLGEQAEKLILKYRKSMEKSSKVFAEQLCSTWDYTFLFVNDRICKHAEKSAQVKFKIAVELLYYP